MFGHQGIQYHQLVPKYANRDSRSRLLLTLTIVCLLVFSLGFHVANTPSKPDRNLRVKGYNGPAPFQCPPSTDSGLRLAQALAERETGVREWTTTIWQSAREAQQAAAVATWRTLNPSWQYELLLDEDASRWVNASLPRELIDVYHQLPSPVMRADMLRYALLWAQGGVWSDIDTVCMKPIDHWTGPLDEVDLLVGSEMDLPLSIDPYWQKWGWSAPDRGWGFVQWTLRARRHSPFLRRTLVSLATRWTSHQANPVKDRDVLSITGPTVFTDSILEELACQLERPVGWMEFTNITSPVRVGRLVALPTIAFNAENGVDDESERLVKHLFASSWKHSSLWPW